MATKAPVSAMVWLAGADAAATGALQPAAEILASFGIGTEAMGLRPDGPFPAVPDGLCAIIAASPDGALPAMLAARVPVPVIRVPAGGDDQVGLALLHDRDGHLHAGPVDGVFATMAIGEAGAKNAALFVIATLALGDERLRAAWAAFRARQTEAVLRQPPLALVD